jgi:rod shape-determining protein MreD
MNQITSQTNSTITLILGSIMLAIILTFIPLPSWAEPYRPEWLILVAIYWSMTTPQTFGLGSAWFSGLIIDVLRGTLLGQHALGFALTAAIGMRIHYRLGNYSYIQQIILVALLLLPYMSLNLWIYGTLDESPETALYWAPVLTTALCWPLLAIIMRASGHRHHVF